MSAQQIARAECREAKTAAGFYFRNDAAIAFDNANRKHGAAVIITGSWRSYATQELIFRQRYEPGAWSPVGDYRRWNGQTWGRVRGAAAAVPGTSNHGGGVAFDAKTRRDKTDPPRDEAIVFTGWKDRDRVAWLKDAREFGWTEDEGKRVGEQWHIRYNPALDKHRGKGVSVKRKPHAIKTIRYGDQGWRVGLAQDVLIDAGLYKGKRDSKFGPAMRTAVKKWQRKQGLADDGVIGEDTWYSFCWGVKAYAEGPRAKVAQRVCGYTGDDVDGSLGNGGRLKQVQRWLGVDADGVWKGDTIAALVKKG